MKKYQTFFFLFVYLFSGSLFWGQKVSIDPIIKITYDASLKLGESYKHNEKFVLLGNSSEFYFAANQNYLNDTGLYKEPLIGISTASISSYFQERVVRLGNSFYTFLDVTDNKIKYEEQVNLKWVLYGEMKVINGVVCQMAATNKFGRRWIAYFAKDSYQIPIGPYKFGGLPGLIFELYDTRDDYHFTLSGIEKNPKTFSFNLNPYKNYTKDKYLKAKYNLEFTVAAFPVMESEQNKYIQSLLDRKKKMYNNPLELKPFE
ncbi:GLPGLI family protein [Elizabethkingia meningoseptica]|uniref:GLPGLI family protein n=1 Tax=Elizabethkingia meningoseptica TaxID=238 RepID=UPI0013656874|nr:GLPGLI family protein [Elizabethkingia meningoseptica]MDE5490309.1 GLPGLI family protein [Elizabethkingia meningoseptica]MVW92188.1 GLPGLI family protein [Elizabethkingia meningoseptica]